MIVRAAGRTRRCRRPRRAGSRPCAGAGRTSGPASCSRSRPSATARCARPRRPGTPGPSGARPRRSRWGSWRSRAARAPSAPSCRRGSGRCGPPRCRRCAGSATAPPGGPPRERAAASSTRTRPPRSPARTGAPPAKVQVLRAGLAEDVPAPPRAAATRDRLLGGHVHDVQRRTGQVREHDRPVRRLLLGLPRPGHPVVVRARSRRGPAPVHQHVDRGPFSACIMMSEPLLAAVCIARRICPSSE